jgi:hypothetical protein
MCLAKGTVELDCISDSVGHTCSQLQGRAVHISSISATLAQMASSFLVSLFSFYVYTSLLFLVKGTDYDINL